MDLKENPENIGLVPVTGLLGSGIEYSLSPMLHAAADSASGRMTDYNLFDIAPGGVDGFIKQALMFGEIVGFNVTTPYKEVVRGKLDAVHHEAIEIGAVNAVTILEGKMIGFNTDRPAFASVLNATLTQGDYPPDGWSVVVMGAGGAARAIVWAVLELGIADEIIIMNRSEDRKVFLLVDIEEIFRDKGVTILQHDWLDWGTLVDKLSNESSGRMLINTTPLGTADERGVVRNQSEIPQRDVLEKFSIVFDLVYNPPVTRLLSAANSAGCKIVGGGGMLIEQAVLSRAVWFGQEHINDERTAMTAAYVTWMKKNFGNVEGG